MTKLEMMEKMWEDFVIHVLPEMPKSKIAIFRGTFIAGVVTGSLIDPSKEEVDQFMFNDEEGQKFKAEMDAAEAVSH